MRIYKYSHICNSSFFLPPRYDEGMEGSKLSDDMLEVVAARFRLLGDPVRLRLLMALEGGERSVNHLVEQMENNQPNISRHLKALADGGILERRRNGTNVFYSIRDPVVLKLCDLVCNSAEEQARIRLRALLPPGAH